jgi:hypothetical protein
MNDFMQGLRDMVKDDEEYATDLSKKTEINDVQDTKDDADEPIDDLSISRTRDVPKENKKKEDDELVK